MRTVLALVLLAVAPAFAAAQASKDDLQKLAKAGLSDDVIIAYLKANGGAAKLSSDDLVALKTAGLSDKVLTAMLAPVEKAKELPTTPAATETPVVVEQPSPVVVVPPVYASGYINIGRPYYSYYYGCYPSYYSYRSCYPSFYRSSSYCAPRFSGSFSVGRSFSGGGRVVRSAAVRRSGGRW